MKNGGRSDKKDFLGFSDGNCWLTAAAFGHRSRIVRNSSQAIFRRQKQTEGKKSESGGMRRKRSEKDKARPKKCIRRRFVGNAAAMVSPLWEMKTQQGLALAGTKKADGKTRRASCHVRAAARLYWRGKAHELLDRITATEQQICEIEGTT